jgi:photosystem II stability/assembly factor-like uncharacterized protein
MKLFLACLLTAVAACGQQWIEQRSGVEASLRGISAANKRTVWASGTGGTVLRTVDGGATWESVVVPGAEKLDFRGIRVIDARTVFLLSSGPGDLSRVYRTTDGGTHWAVVFTNPDPPGFFDAIAFWDSKHGIIAGDPVGGSFTIFTTFDGGTNWDRRAAPAAASDEGAFAASNSCIMVRNVGEVWFGTGGPGGGRVFHSWDRGVNWTRANTGIRNDSQSAGVFSLWFRDAHTGIAVGGDYRNETETRGNVALTSDGGRSWKKVSESNGPHGYRSAVMWLPADKLWIATGTSGSDVSRDGGKTWKLFDSGAYNALGASQDGSVWAVGPKGRIAKLSK